MTLNIENINKIEERTILASLKLYINVHGKNPNASFKENVSAAKELAQSITRQSNMENAKQYLGGGSE